MAPSGPDSSADLVWASPQRKARFELWLGQLDPSLALLAPSLRLASADASYRRYFRIDAAAGGSFIIMDAPPDRENSEPFVRIGRLMAAAGLRVPQVHSWNAEDGFLLLEDLGPSTMLEALQRDNPQANRPLYQDAVNQLVALQRASQPGVLPAYDQVLLLRELELFTDWYLGHHLGVGLDAAQRAVLDESFALIIQHNLASASVYVHRDYMPRNFVLPPESRAQDVVRLGVLDFQDAVYGPISYDIASLMRDAFVSWDEEFVLDMTVRYWQKARSAGLPVDADFGSFYRAVEWIGLQRHLKVAGIFARLTLRDGKPKYLADTPRFIAYIRATAARYRELKPLLRLLDQVEGTQGLEAYSFGRT